MTKKTNKIKHEGNSEASELPDDKLPSSDKKLGSFADRLRETIGGQSVRSFAAACNLSDGVIRQYLAGKSEPGLEALLKIAYVGNVNIEWLASGNGEKIREPFSIFLKGATERRKRTSLFNARTSIVLECFNTVNIQSILNRNERAELINFVNDYNSNIILPAKEGSDRLIKSITVSDLTDWCREAWLYSETFLSWYKSSYYQYKRGQIRKDHPLAWTINNAGTSEAEMRRGAVADRVADTGTTIVSEPYTDGFAPQLSAEVAELAALLENYGNKALKADLKAKLIKIKDMVEG